VHIVSITYSINNHNEHLFPTTYFLFLSFSSGFYIFPLFHLFLSLFPRPVLYFDSFFAPITELILRVNTSLKPSPLPPYYATLFYRFRAHKCFRPSTQDLCAFSSYDLYIIAIVSLFYQAPLLSIQAHVVKPCIYFICPPL